MKTPDDAVCYRLADGTLVDLSVDSEAKAEVVSQTDPDGLEVLRHSVAHVLAQAVTSLWPGAKYAIGPPIEDPPGFYYDFDVEKPFTPDDLERIEAKMREIVGEDQKFVREELDLDKARKVFDDQPYKLEILDGIGEDSYEQGVQEDKVSLYRNDGFVDLCRGPHIPSSGKIHSFKLLRSSGAYWRGDEKNTMLQRIYGTAWASQDQLDDYLSRVEEAERRDHAKLGRKLELFATYDLLPAGFPVWLPKGALVRRLLEDYIVKKEQRAGYQHVYTPHVGRKELYETSGHWEHFGDDMFPVIELEHDTLALKPMNCPHHILIYRAQTRSYRDLPLRIAELGAMYRFERSGTLRGLNRVRYMTLNDAHIFCRLDQVTDEFTAVVKMVEEVYSDLGITDYRFRLSLHDPDDSEKYHSDTSMWGEAENLIRGALDAVGVEYYEAKGEASFYGPKVDIQLIDTLGREETYSTIQLDFLLPERFGLTHVGDDGNEHRTVMIHRGVISTMERIVAYLIELYAGAFPTWLSPVQVSVLPIADRHQSYAEEVLVQLVDAGARAEIEGADETLGNRVRKGQGQKVPYLLIAGDREVEAKTVSVRERTGTERKAVPVAQFVEELMKESASFGSPESRAAG